MNLSRPFTALPLRFTHRVKYRGVSPVRVGSVQTEAASDCVCNDTSRAPTLNHVYRLSEGDTNYE